jgi:hypothetical protein
VKFEPSHKSEKSIVPNVMLARPSVVVIICNNFVEFIFSSGANKTTVTKLIEIIVPIEKEIRNIIPFRKLL